MNVFRSLYPARISYGQKAGKTTHVLRSCAAVYDFF